MTATLDDLLAERNDTTWWTTPEQRARQRDLIDATRRTVDPRKTAERARRRQLLADIHWLLDTDTPDSIARRVGYATAGSLHRRLQRIGQHDLARHFDPDKVTR